MASHGLCVAPIIEFHLSKLRMTVYGKCCGSYGRVIGCIIKNNEINIAAKASFIKAIIVLVTGWAHVVRVTYAFNRKILVMWITRYWVNNSVDYLIDGDAVLARADPAAGLSDQNGDSFDRVGD